MATNSVACIGQRSACAVRATRLGPDCAPATGTGTDFVVTTALMTFSATPDVEEGTKFEPKNACGDLLWTAADQDIVKRWTVEFEFGLFDYELAEILTDSTAIIGGAASPWVGKTIGIESPGPNTDQGNGVALEIWVKTATDQGVCGDVSQNPPLVRHVFPRCLIRLNDRTFENDVATFKFSGTAETNVLWGFGPYGDFPGAAPLSGDTPYAQFLDTVLPDATCGYGDLTP
jgi:hypothetical protein